MRMEADKMNEILDAFPVVAGEKAGPPGMELVEIYNRYCKRVWYFVLSLVRDEWVADDLSQETFIRVQQKLDTLQESSKLASWIFQIAYNLCRDHLRSRKKTQPNECELSEVTAGFKGASVQKKLEQCEMAACVQSVVRLIPAPLRSVVMLFDMAELSHREIAEILNTSVDNVKVRLHRARKKLRALLEERCAFEVDERNVLICEPLHENMRSDMARRSRPTYTIDAQSARPSGYALIGVK